MPYFVISSIVYVAWVLLKHDRPLAEPLINILWQNQTGIPIATAIWFLSCLFIMELIFIVMMNTLKKDYYLYGAVLLLAISALLWNWKIGIELPWSTVPAIIGLPFYTFGYILKKNNLMSIEKIRKIPIWLIILVFIMNLICIHWNSSINMRTGAYGNAILFYINAIVATCIIWCISGHIVNLIKNTRILRDLSSIGKESLVYLCTNQALITVSEMTFGKILKVESLTFKLVTLVFVFFTSALIIKCLSYGKEIYVRNKR